MTKVKISVIVPVYNTSHFLSTCIESILNQSFDDFELIIIDDGSTDGSGEICENYAQSDQRVKVYHQENAGQSSARNFGLSRATGEFINFVDSDDFVEKDYLKILYELLVENEADLSSCMMTSYDTKTDIVKPARQHFAQVFETNQVIIKAYLQENPFHFGPVTKLYKSALLENIRFTEGKIYEDYFFNYQYFSRIKKAVSTTYDGYFYVKNEASTVRRNFQLKDLDNIPEQHQVLEAVKKDYPSLLPIAAYNLKSAYYWFFSKILNVPSVHTKIFFQTLRHYLLADRSYLRESLPFKNRKHDFFLFTVIYFPILLRFAYRIRTARKAK